MNAIRSRQLPRLDDFSGAPRPIPVAVEVVRELRAEILRPGQFADELRYAGDEAPDTLHAAVFDRGDPIAAASIMREPFPERRGADDWRVRGMATTPHARGRGVGTALLQACVAHALAQQGEVVWCNARVPARGFYERGGFSPLGDVFEIPGIGPHVLMWRLLR